MPKQGKIYVFYIRNSLIKEMSLGTVEKDQVVFSQGSFGDYFYILKEGEVALFVNQKLVKNIKPGESFGELGIDFIFNSSFITSFPKNWNG